MTVKEMLDWYQFMIDDYTTEYIHYYTIGDTESENFYKGVVFGLNHALIALHRHKKEGLKGDD